jgi:hypothetical protein
MTKKSSPSGSKTELASRQAQRAQERKRAKLEVKERKTAIRSAAITPGTWQTNLVTFLLLTIATLALYAGDLRLGFFKIDDQQYVVNNPWIRGLSMENLRHILTTPYFVNYSPLHLLSYLLDDALAGA